jgi:hypothetical protein
MWSGIGEDALQFGARPFAADGHAFVCEVGQIQPRAAANSCLLITRNNTTQTLTDMLLWFFLSVKALTF